MNAMPGAAFLIAGMLSLAALARADEIRIMSSASGVDISTGFFQPCEATHFEDPVPGVVGRVAGTRPVWLADGLGFGMFPGAKRPVKSLWVLAREVAGGFRVEGRRLDGAGTTRFQVGGMDTPITDTLVVEKPAAQSVIPGGASADVMKAYAFIPSYVFYPSPGCWQLTAHLGDTDTRIVLEVK